jgi:hypothetical protein
VNHREIVNSKSIKKNSISLKRKLTEEDLFKISPKIQKKRILRRKKRKESYFKNYDQLDNTNLIHQLNKKHFSSKAANLEYLPTTSIDSKYKPPFPKESTQQPNSIFQNIKPRNGSRLFDNPNPYKETTLNKNSQNMLGVLNPLLSPLPQESTHQNQTTTRFNFLSSKKVKSQKQYSLTPNPKQTSQTTFQPNRKSSKLLELKLGLPNSKKVTEDSSSFLMNSTPQIRNSNIVTSSSYNNPLDLFTPKLLPSKRTLPEQSLSNSALLSSQNLPNKFSSRNVSTTNIASSSQKVNLPFQQPNPFTSIFNSKQILNPGPVYTNTSSLQMQGHLNPGSSYPYDFSLQIPPTNKVQYSAWNNNTTSNPNVGNGYSNYFLGHPPQGELMNFLGARGSILQRQFEQKVFNNKKSNKKEQRTKNNKKDDYVDKEQTEKKKEKRKKYNNRRNQKYKEVTTQENKKGNSKNGKEDRDDGEPVKNKKRNRRRRNRRRY